MVKDKPTDAIGSGENYFLVMLVPARPARRSTARSLWSLAVGILVFLFSVGSADAWRPQDEGNPSRVRSGGG
jgi:hypothetical protein